MMLIYDPEGDVAQVELREIPDGGIDHTDDVSRGHEYSRGIDRAADGTILTYNFMRASQGVDLAGLPHQRELVELFAQVSKISIIAGTA